MTNTANAEIVIDRQSDKEIVVGDKTATSGTWAVGARLVSRIVDLTTMLVLAHILKPRDFGLVAIAMIVIYILEAALELPLSQALVRLPRIRASHYDTAFTLSLIRGVALSVIIALTSWPFAQFYADKRLIPLVCLLSFAPAARGLVSPRLTDYAKNLDFSREFATEFVGKIAAATCAIGVAVVTKSYWSIAAGTIISPVAATITSYLIAPYRPRLSLAELPSFSGFLGWFTAAQVVAAINWQCDRLFLGKLISKAELGLFTTANDTANIPLLTFFGPILRPLLSAFAILRGEPWRLANSYQKSACAIVTVALPVLVGESLLAEPAVRLVFGEKWIGAVPLLRWLALSLIPALFAIPFGPLVMSFNRTQFFLKRNIVELCVKLPLVIVGTIKFGFAGAIFARFISEMVAAFFCMRVVRQLIGISIHRQLLGMWRSFISALTMAIATHWCMPYLIHTDNTLRLAFGTVVTVIVGSIVYMGVLLCLWRSIGSPPGVEAMVIERISGLINRVRGSEVTETV
jgi:O-antigen/teichoic acid export membrane protein